VSPTAASSSIAAERDGAGTATAALCTSGPGRGFVCPSFVAGFGRVLAHRGLARDPFPRHESGPTLMGGREPASGTLVCLVKGTWHTPTMKSGARDSLFTWISSCHGPPQNSTCQAAEWVRRLGQLCRRGDPSAGYRRVPHSNGASATLRFQQATHGFGRGLGRRGTGGRACTAD